MSNWNLVWLQPKAAPATYSYTHPSLRTFITETNRPSEKEQQKVEHLQRPTKSFMAKCEPVEKKRFIIERYMEQDRHSWKKMEYFKDCMDCMYRKDGSVKKGNKI